LKVNLKNTHSNVVFSFQNKLLLIVVYLLLSGEQRLHATFLGSSDDGNNSDCYDARQSPPKAIVDSSPLQPAMDKNKECELTGRGSIP